MFILTMMMHQETWHKEQGNKIGKSVNVIDFPTVTFTAFVLNLMGFDYSCHLELFTTIECVLDSDFEILFPLPLQHVVTWRELSAPQGSHGAH